MVAELTIQDDASAVAFGWAKRSFAARDGLGGRPVPTPIGQFSSLLAGFGSRIAMTSDGIGTKIEIAERMGRYDTLGTDLLAMVIDDLAANGVEPCVISNILDVDRVDANVVDQLMAGLCAAALQAKVAVVGGEIAELGSRIGGWGDGMHFNWCATAIGNLRDGWAPVDGSTIAIGDAVIALQSTSYRSNGYSALRKTLTAHFGENWHNTEFEGKSWGNWLLEPCRVYAPLIVAMRENNFSFNGLSHITGGGIGSKFGRTLKASGLGADLTHLFEPTAAMLEVQRLGNYSDTAAYQHWNMGNGFLLTVDASGADAAVAFANGRGYMAQRCGQIVAAPRIEIRNPRFTLQFQVG